ncbi:MAG: deoxyribodipyrimidine photolyase [Gemmatimonadota bacterium]
MKPVPDGRIQRLNEARPDPMGEYVLYWMTAQRRLGWNFALDRACYWAHELGRPLLIFEAVRAAYPWASPRHHAPIMIGMHEHAVALDGTGVGYFPYVEPAPGDGDGLLHALAARAACVVTDDAPTFFTPRLVDAASRLESTYAEAVDSCGVLPLREPGRTFSAAFHFRRHLHKVLRDHVMVAPSPDPLAQLRVPALGGLPTSVTERWPATTRSALEALHFPRLGSTTPVVGGIGGTIAGRRRLDTFLSTRLSRYADDRNHPDLDVVSGLSPWLHYGHISTHEVLAALFSAEEWTPNRLSERADGRRAGWWGMSPSAEAFVDQLVTWRELGFGFAHFEPDYTTYESLPEWARVTLEDHAPDPREHLYSLDAFDAAETHDDLWNAAQRQLRTEGVIHNYLRMLWGKKILEWSAGPREALDIMIELNNCYSVDGRDPNSYSGIFWTMGRFDRGWPERAIFGKVRSMTSASTRRKVKLTRYLERFGEGGTQLGLL